MITDEMQDIINQVDTAWTKDYIIRYLYVKLAPFFQRDLTYFLATDEQKYNEYQQGFITRGTNIVCSTISDFYVNLYNTFGINAKKVISNSARIPLFAVIVKGDFGWYFIDPLNDLFLNQFGLQTTEFGKVPHYKTLNNNYPFLVTLSNDYINEIDRHLNLKDPLDDFFKEIHLEMTNRSLVRDIFNLPNDDNTERFNRKMEFSSTHLINFGRVTGPFERLQLYLYLERMIFFKAEKKNLKIYLNSFNNKYFPQIEYTDYKHNTYSAYKEEQENGVYVLKKID